MMRQSAAYWIETLGLIPHPEGGFFVETLRSQEILQKETLPARYHSARPTYTCIYYLLQAGQFSCFHRLKSDEIWHHYAGAPMCIHILAAEGAYSQQVIGKAGQGFHCLVPHGVWFATEPLVDATQDYSLVGCSVAPAFDYDDWEAADRATLLASYPEHANLIHTFTYLDKPTAP